MDDLCIPVGLKVGIVETIWYVSAIRIAVAEVD